ncbi:MAG: Uma2 family endonuclease [Planctomycetota bacterium]
MAGPEMYSISRSEYYLMGDIGILSEGDRTELIDGVVFVKEPIGPWHASTVDLLSEAFAPIRSLAAQRIQNPVTLTEFSEPQPDFSLLRPPLRRYRETHPTPADILLAVEVADTSRVFDRDTKRPLYARAGIREYWIIDRHDDCVEVARDPESDGYRTVRSVGRGETLTLLAFPGFNVPADAILGPVPTP